ncbi:MAG: MFS transporter [Micrococcales bacterium]|nr:MFS transporter [Micrococcales bacterium]
MKVLDDLRVLLRLPGFRRLFTVRVVSQAGDGIFQIGLATLFFFSPERMATAQGVAAGFAVLLLPFTVVGPFAGPLLDRWRRRQVLLIANLVRLVLTLILAAVIVTQGVSVGVYVLALVILGVNRFLLSALSAGQPRVVPPERLLVANSLTPTLGGVAAVVGAGVGFLVGRMLPAGVTRDGLTLVFAAVVFGIAATLALRLGADQLGPDRAERRASGWGALGSDLRATVTDLAAGARHLVARRTPGAAIGAMGIQRFMYGVNFLALILISRNLLTDPADADAGLRMFALLTAVSFLGNGLAVLVTPVVHVDPTRWIVVCLGIGGVSQAVLATTPTQGVIVAAAILLGVSVQGTKIAVDTIVQRDTKDAFRGRAFALYDVAFNALFVAAAALAATLLPDTGWTRLAFVALAVVYLALAAVYTRVPRSPLDVPCEAGR